MKSLSLSFSLICLGLVSSLQAANVAVIDSGVDYKHPMLKSNMWRHPDRSLITSYVLGMNGWNFSENNAFIFDHNQLSTFSPDLKKYIDITSKSFLFSATEAEKAWVKKKLKDPEFEKDAGRYGTYIHGTHVAGIAMKGSANKILGIKLLATPVKATLKETQANKINMTNSEDPEKKLTFLLARLALKDSFKMNKIGNYLAENKADVANGSFGMGIYKAANIAYLGFTMAYKREPTKMELVKFSKIFMALTIKSYESFVKASPNTLFVFASGNDGLSNDLLGTAPANVKADNTISVAATYKDLFFAPFSNFGTKMVEVAAPGMLINSSIPGDDYLQVSGTSQAAPFVSNAAGKMKDANPALTPLQLKRILMGTVDKKDFLKTRVTSGGIVNPERAIFAAWMARMISVEEAIERSLVSVPTKKSRKTSFVIPKNFKPIEMPSMFE